MVEYQRKTSSGVAKAALATSIGVGALGLLNGSLGGLSPNGGGIIPARGPYGAPVVFAGGHYGPDCGYVTEKEMCLIRENSAQGSEIARLNAEKYADAVVKSEVEPLKVRVCELETASAVNAARDRDFRRYVDHEFVHQPKAKMRQSIVVCKQCGCDCECDC